MACGYCLAPADGATPVRLTAEDYARAERFLPWNSGKHVLNGNVAYRWIGEEDRLWYLHETKQGREFIVLDATTGKHRPAFDHAALAGALSRAAGQAVEPGKLPFDAFEFVDGGRAITVASAGKSWRCKLGAECEQDRGAGVRPGELASPDGRWAAFLKGSDIWLRSLTDGNERALSTDGQQHYAYGQPAGSSLGLITLRRQGKPIAPIAVWSNDSTKLLTHRLDERAVKDLYFLQSVPEDGSVRPLLHSTRFPMPGDEQATVAELVVFEVAGGRVDMKFPPLPVTTWSPVEESRAWWSADGNTVYAVPRELGQKRLRLLAMDAVTGVTKSLMEESAPSTFIEAGGEASRVPDIRVLRSGEIIWYSERDDWGHLYLYDAHSKLIRPLISGAWRIMRIVHVDERRHRVYFLGVGREAGEDPYQRHLYSVDLDGSGLRSLTPENADHEVRIAVAGYYARTSDTSLDATQAGFSTSGRYFVETYSRPDLPPTTLLRRADGRLVSVLAEADISSLQAGGFTMPEPFKVLAADGETALYGNLLRPSRFDPGQRYPVVDAVYPGPQGIRTAKSFMRAVFDWDHAQALAELGFIVVTMDGRGTSFRSKSFHDASYGKLQSAGSLEDHMAGLRQLAQRHPGMDLERVGVYGHSGGGYAAARAILAYPDFYKVAVSSAGNHDQRGYSLMWGPTYQGSFDEKLWEPQINARLAAQLKGRLFLIHGDMDDNVHPAHTMQLAAALMKANADFDLLIVPNANHSMSGSVGYFTRRRWDYFVRNLMGAEPPAGYRITAAE